jgi:O-antigen/teichoic acid export membrane protein
MATLSKYLKETFWALAGKIVAGLFYYATVYLLTRRMAVDVWGEWSAFFAILNVTLVLSDQGINSASRRYIAAARDTEQLGDVVRTTFALRLIASLLYTAVVAVIAKTVLAWLHQPQFLPLIRQALLLIVLFGVLEYFKDLFEALHRLRFTFVVTALEYSLKFLFIFLLFRGGENFGAIVLAFTLAVVIAISAGAFQALAVVPHLLATTLRSALLRKAYLYSIPVLLASIGGFIALEIDVIMLKNLRGTYETGIFSAAKQIVMFLPQISLVLAVATIPGFAKFALENAALHRRLYYRVLAGVIALYLVGCASLVIFAKWGIPLFFPAQYRGAAAPLLMLIPFVLFSAITIYTGNLMIYRGLAWHRTFNAALALGGNIALNFWLIPIWGPVGSAAASSIAYFPYCLLNLRAAHCAFEHNS